jgi:hypothetical protein
MLAARHGKGREGRSGQGNIEPSFAGHDAYCSPWLYAEIGRAGVMFMRYKDKIDKNNVDKITRRKARKGQVRENASSIDGNLARTSRPCLASSRTVQHLGPFPSSTLPPSTSNRLPRLRKIAASACRSDSSVKRRAPVPTDVIGAR